MSEGQAATLEVSVDARLCVSSGNCAMSAPAVFDQSDEDGVVVLLDAHPPADQRPGVEQAEELCPVRAIRLAGS